MQLSFGLSRAVPADVTTAWGARLIEPADLIPDRQDLKADDDAASEQLARWLNGGALAQARKRLRDMTLPQSTEVATVHEDGTGKIVASTNRSHGYIYLAAWLIAKHPSPEAAQQLREVVADGDLSEADDLIGCTDCPKGCYVEPDGHCPHGYESAALTLGVI